MDLRALNVNHCLKNLKCPQILQFIYEINVRCFLKFDNTLKSCMLFSIMNVRQELLKCKRKKTQPLINCPGENTCYFTHWNVVIGLFYYLTPTRMAIIKIQTIISVGLGYRELGTLIHGNTRWCSHCDAQFGTKIKWSYI